MTPKHWNHTRRAAHPQNADPFNALINESADAAASGNLLRAVRMLRYVEHLARLRKRHRPPLVIERTPSPPPTPAQPPLQTISLPQARAGYSDSEKLRLATLYRLGGIEHLMPPFDQ